MSGPLLQPIARPPAGLGLAPARPLRWQLATVVGVRTETERVKTLVLRLPDPQPHRAGQHVDLRLTAEDGYQAQRSYSLASSPERLARDGVVELTVERIEDGEVSGYLHDVLREGDRIEVRGPIGGYFAWEAADGGPVLFVGGGSGVVPLAAMLRHRAAQPAGVRAGIPAALLYSARTFGDVLYRDELAAMAASDPDVSIAVALTRGAPEGWEGGAGSFAPYARRIDRAMIEDVTGALGGLAALARAYVCGPTAFVEAAAVALVSAGTPPERVRTERFGPSGR